ARHRGEPANGGGAFAVRGREPATRAAHPFRAFPESYRVGEQNTGIRRRGTLPCPGDLPELSSSVETPWLHHTLATVNDGRGVAFFWGPAWEWSAAPVS